MSFIEAWHRFRLPTGEEMKERIQAWFERCGSTFAISIIAHVMLLLVLMIVLRQVIQAEQTPPPEIDSVAEATPEIPIFELGKEKPQYETSELTDDTLKQLQELPVAQTAQYNDDSPVFEERGGGTATGIATGGGLGFDISAPGLGPALKGGGGIESGLGEGTRAGRGGAGEGYGLRGSGSREAIPGVTRASERAVAAALNWLARHQNPDGSWNMNHGNGTKCKDKTCTGGALMQSDPAATALALLPFLAAGQTHEKGTYKEQVGKGIAWLIKNQKASGDLSSGDHQMYTHGLCAIAMCEAYGMTQDSKLASHAQSAVKFIETGMNAQGGWRYQHGTNDSDLSVFGWELMALKSGKMAGLNVDNGVFEKAQTFLGTVKVPGGAFCYTPGNPSPKRSMTGIGVLASQYLGAKKDDPVIRDGVQYLMGNIPVAQEYDTYYWYYATLAMHNVPGPDWEKWNRAMRKLLIDAQTKSGCATGSWNPDPDHWGAQGGRMMVTSLSCLTLEVYYRYSPLFKMDRSDPAAMEK